MVNYKWKDNSLYAQESEKEEGREAKKSSPGVAVLWGRSNGREGNLFLELRHSGNCHDDWSLRGHNL